MVILCHFVAACGPVIIIVTVECLQMVVNALDHGALPSIISEPMTSSGSEASDEESLSSTSSLDVNLRARVPGTSRVMLHSEARAVSVGSRMRSHPEVTLRLQKELQLKIGGIARRIWTLRNTVSRLSQENEWIWNSSEQQLQEVRQELILRHNTFLNGASTDAHLTRIGTFCRNRTCALHLRFLLLSEHLELGRRVSPMPRLCNQELFGCPALLISSGLMDITETIMSSLMTSEGAVISNGSLESLISTLSECRLRVDLWIGSQQPSGLLPTYIHLAGTQTYLMSLPYSGESRRLLQSLPRPDPTTMSSLI